MNNHLLYNIIYFETLLFIAVFSEVVGSLRVVSIKTLSYNYFLLLLSERELVIDVVELWIKIVFSHSTLTFIFFLDLVNSLHLLLLFSSFLDNY